MGTDVMQDKILARGMDIFRRTAAVTPAVFDRKWWAGRLLESVMDNPRLKMQLFRFVDVFPALAGPEQVAAHLHERGINDRHDLEASTDAFCVSVGVKAYGFDSNSSMKFMVSGPVFVAKP